MTIIILELYYYQAEYMQHGREFATYYGYYALSSDRWAALEKFDDFLLKHLIVERAIRANKITI